VCRTAELKCYHLLSFKANCIHFFLSGEKLGLESQGKCLYIACIRRQCSGENLYMAKVVWTGITQKLKIDCLRNKYFYNYQINQNVCRACGRSEMHPKLQSESLG